MKQLTKNKIKIYLWQSVVLEMGMFNWIPHFWGREEAASSFIFGQRAAAVLMRSHVALLSAEVGASACKFLTAAQHASKGAASPPVKKEMQRG